MTQKLQKFQLSQNDLSIPEIVLPQIVVPLQNQRGSLYFVSISAGDGIHVFASFYGGKAGLSRGLLQVCARKKEQIRRRLPVL